MALAPMTVKFIRGGLDHHNHGNIGSFFIRQFLKEAGDAHQGHEHWIDHCTFFEEGMVLLEREYPDGTHDVLVVEAPAVIETKKGVKHKITPLVRSRWRCVFSEAEANVQLSAEERDRIGEDWHLERKR